MPEQVRKQASHRTTTNNETAADKLPHAEHKSGDELRAEMDAIIDDIDAVLEEDGISTEKEAFDFVDQYRQKGGE